MAKFDTNHTHPEERVPAKMDEVDECPPLSKIAALFGKMDSTAKAATLKLLDTFHHYLLSGELFTVHFSGNSTGESVLNTNNSIDCNNAFELIFNQIK